MERLLVFYYEALGNAIFVRRQYPLALFSAVILYCMLRLAGLLRPGAKYIFDKTGCGAEWMPGVLAY